MVRLNKKQIVKNAKKYYQKLMVSPIYSPALKADVYFTNKGINHLAHSSKRSFNDVYRRLKLLPYIKPTITHTKIFKSRTMGQITSFELSHLSKIKIHNHFQNKNIKVVVILTSQNKYTFLSVM
jgi:hypothetical protein